MAAAGTRLSPELKLSWDLDQVFWHFLPKFQALPTPRSVCEARVSAAEIQFLGKWFAERGGWPRSWCEKTWQDRVEVESDYTASDREMFGALFLIFAAEVIRDQCDEESVWPAISKALSGNKDAHSALFDTSGQPATSCKAAIAAAVRKLDLRNLIDLCGKQEYFDTLKLQIGFTFKGARLRLPEWLDGFEPTAVRILTGELQFDNLSLESASFKQVWTTLKDYRRNRASSAFATAVLESSSWIRLEWIPELMAAAKMRLGSVSAPIEGAAFDVGEGHFCEPILRWAYPAKPALHIRLNEEKVYERLGNREACTFVIDGQVVDRWTAREGGGWNGKRELPCNREGAARPNLRPRLLAINSGDSPIDEIDLSELGLAEPLLLFDLVTGRMRDPLTKLDPNRDYGLLCDPNMEVAGVQQVWKGKDRLACHLSRPLSRDCQVLYGGAPFWEPQLADIQPRRLISLTLESLPGECVDIETAAHIEVKGVPEDVSEVWLITESVRQPLTQAGTAWRTQQTIKITLGIAMGSDRIWIVVKGTNFKRTIAPKVSLNLRGVAAIETDGQDHGDVQWKILKKHQSLNRAAGTGKVRIFAPAGTFDIFEGPCLITKRTSRAVDLRELHGWGYPLLTRSEGNDELVLVGSVEDHGCVGLFVGMLGHKSWNTLHRRTPQVPSKDRAVWVWSSLHDAPRCVSGNAIQSDAEGFVWTLREIGQVAALAVTYKGCCLGSYWNSNLISADMNRSPSAKVFALIRWLRIPVMNQTFRPSLQKAISRAPGEFIQGWLGNTALPSGLGQRLADQGLETVIRGFLWDHVERNESRMNLLAGAFRRREASEEVETEADEFKRMVAHIGGICPSQAYGFAKLRIHGEKYRKLLRCVVAEMLGQTSNELSQLRDALAKLRYGCSVLTGISQDELHSAMDMYQRGLDSQVSSKLYDDRHLRRLGETVQGRHFLTSSLLLKLLRG